MRFPPFQERLLGAVLPVCDRYGLLLAGVHALRAHGCTHRPSRNLHFATAGETPLPDVAQDVAGALQEAGLEATVIEVTPRLGRLLARDTATGETCAFGLMREALQQRPVTRGTVKVLGLDDAVGLKMRAVHERGLARDIIDVAAVGHLYSFRELESLARPHNDCFSPYELASRLESVDFMSDEEFEGYGLDEARIRAVRRFARAWLEDIKLRRADDGDAEYDHPDVPEID
ncbi:hypothetical protein [Nonomuraea candida]|uniref:hypothetical protein n=1 Tax=Nonomuraea candida TaxID=359159 RepID=UPI0005BD274F|nr:hypothetical protein [Nonomuraea candida]